MNMIDAHIHLDQYTDDEFGLIMKDSSFIEGFIAVSFNLSSCQRNLLLSRKYHRVYSAFGYHPEQPLINSSEVNELIDWMSNYMADLIAIGEVGLPYYLKKDGKVSGSQFNQYVCLLEMFIQHAKKWNKPIILHAVYEDAPIVCDLLEKHSVTKAHFHWFKGDSRTIERMIQNGYYISVTPDVVYEEEIQQLVKCYPLDKIMVETDGPWPFEGPFAGKMTHPNMMQDSIQMIAKIKNRLLADVGNKLLENTKVFYQI